MSLKNRDFPYADIIDLPHHVSAKHPQMSREARAAQFAPFAALTGFGDAIGEAGRRTFDKTELSEDARDELDRRLSAIIQCDFKPELCVRYFRKDEIKEGGAYVTVSGRLKEIDRKRRNLILESGEIIPLEDVAGIESSVLSGGME